MRLKSIFLSIVLLSVCFAYSQDLNLSFENKDLKPWYLIGEPGKYTILPDTDVFYTGQQSLHIQNDQHHDSFGGVMLWLPHNLQGDSIEFSAMIKLEDVDEKSKLGFMLRIDPEVYFNNLQESAIRGTSDWTEYKIKTKLFPQRTSGIAIGVFLSGQGKIWADDVQIRVDGKDITLFSDMFVPFVADQSSITTSGITNFNTNDVINSRLVDLAKIWGLLKYRHPEIAKGHINWDQQLFKSLHEVITAKNNQAIEQHYTNLLDSLGEFAPVSSKEPLSIKQSANYSWIDGLPYTTHLKEELKKLRYSSFETHHYFGFQPGVGNVRITNELGYKHLENPDVGFRLLSLFRYWNIVQYFSPYRYLTEKPWDEVLKEYIPKMITSRGALAYQVNVSAMLSEMKDAHTQLWSNPKALTEAYGNRSLPAQIKYVEGQPIVVKLTNTEEIQTDLKVGDIVLRKNGKTPHEIQDSLYHIIATPNTAVTERGMATKLMQTKEDKAKLEIDRAGKKLTVEVPSIAIKDFKPLQDTTAVKMLTEGIGYINQEFLTKSHILRYGDEAMNLKGIVIDMRNYPRSDVRFLTVLLIPEATEFVKFTKTNYNYLGDFVFTTPVRIGINNPHYYKGKVAILINEKTQSAAEYNTMAFRLAPKAKVFGSQTAGADGNMSYFTLPGGLNSAISGIGIYYPDGGETQRIGIIPDVEVKPTIQGIRAGRDEVLEKALEYINED